MSKAPSVEDIMRWRDAATDEWLAQHATEEQVRSAIFNALDSKLLEVVGSLIGLRQEWGEWRVDYTNGRDPIAAKRLYENAADAVNAWLDKQSATPWPDLPARAKNALRSEYRHCLESCAKDFARKQARLDAARVVATALGVATAEDQ